MNPEEYRIMFELEDQHAWYVGLRKMVALSMQKAKPSFCFETCSSQSCRVLDVGCGTGATLVFLRQFAVPFGIDISEQAVRFCRSRCEDRTAVGSALALPFPDESFNGAFSLDVLCHKAVTDKIQPLKEVFRILRPGGVFVLNLPAFQWLYSSHDINVHTDRRFSRPEVEQMLRQNGFSILYTTYWNTLILPALLGVRLWRKIAPSRQSDVAFSSGPLATRVLSLSLSFERLLLRWVRFPFGLSILVVAQKPA
ncbi:MAG TPA: class I SAM-dependent methyltransferase [Candidatus Hydrogenedentes bacterium]|nr:class I SAM-dependent methyltransferase [Candidatus Hydrogenedentota bacterium]HPO86019.1 class I SAM-dependent methyltransferase [Candidatus Hydrogenedentota bacterium]